MLHTLSHSPFHCDMNALLRCLGAGDALLLLQDGVIAALAGTDIAARLIEKGIPMYVIKNDVEARGLSEQISNSFVSISYNQFVQLTVAYPQQLAW